MRSLYVHVPFCPTICPYCDFHVVRRHGDVVDRYLDRLAQEAERLHQRFPEPLETLYFGGGTPSFLREAELIRLFTLPWQVAPGGEVTLEANPGTLNPERLRLLKTLGVTRLSIGVQSFDDRVLKALGRAHRARGAYRAIEEAQQAGFRVSIDLILGLPGQDVRRDLLEATALGVGHVSAYTLIVEPGTRYALEGLHPDPEAEGRALELAEEILGEAGLVRYEVSNFARPGEAARHNLVYWRMGFWGGLGPAATGHLPPTTEDPGLYAQRWRNPPLPRWLAGESADLEPVTPSEHVREAIMMGLRTREGVDLRALGARTGHALCEQLAGAIAALEQRGLVIYDPPRLRPTSRGLNLAHAVVLELWEALEGG